MRVLVWFLVLIAFTFFLQIVDAKAKCDRDDPRISGELKEISAKQKVLALGLKGLQEGGQTVKMGKCQATVLRLADYFSAMEYPYSIAPNEARKDIIEASSCLALDRFALVQRCICHDLNLPFNMDESLEKEDEEILHDISVVRSKLPKAVMNPAIRSIIQRSDDIKACFDKGTLLELEKISHALHSVVPEHQ